MHPSRSPRKTPSAAAISSLLDGEEEGWLICEEALLFFSEVEIWIVEEEYARGGAIYIGRTGSVGQLGR